MDVRNSSAADPTIVTLDDASLIARATLEVLCSVPEAISVIFSDDVSTCMMPTATPSITALTSASKEHASFIRSCLRSCANASLSASLDSWRALFSMAFLRNTSTADAISPISSRRSISARLRVLQSQLMRELHFWLLTGRHGGAIRSLGVSHSYAQRVARAVALVRANLAKPLRVDRLAEAAGMSVSSFYEHFRDVTSLTPLQFQKQLRLIEARRMMLAEGTMISNAAYGVGYESIPQFTREYSRMFGLPPARDMKAARGRVQPAAEGLLTTIPICSELRNFPWSSANPAFPATASPLAKLVRELASRPGAGRGAKRLRVSGSVSLRSALLDWALCWGLHLSTSSASCRFSRAYRTGPNGHCRWPTSSRTSPRIVMPPRSSTPPYPCRRRLPAVIRLL